MRFIKLPKKSYSIVGFTLIELMIAISVVAILSTIGITVYSQGQKFARDSRRKGDLRQIQTALNLFYQDFKRYPCSAVNNWTHSADAGWLTDNNACVGMVGTNTNMVPNYISQMPKDPLKDTATSESAGGSGYAYFSIDAAHGNCARGQYFVLVTHLENLNDPDAMKADKTICGSVVYTLVSYGNTAYFVTQP